MSDDLGVGELSNMKIILSGLKILWVMTCGIIKYEDHLIRIENFMSDDLEAGALSNMKIILSGLKIL